MKDTDVIDSFHNAWMALARQYDKYPDEKIRDAMNLLSKMIGEVESKVKESHEEKQITIDEWLEWLSNL